MNIYISHSSNFDYQNELYLPLKSINRKVVKFILPHDTDYFIDVRDIANDIGMVIAEVSFPSTGQGLELVWLYDSKRKIICIHKLGTKYSSSLALISDIFHKYDNLLEIINKII